MPIVATTQRRMSDTQKMDGKMKGVRIEMPKSMFDGGAKVYADVGRGEEKIFEFYPDEISFSVSELEGLSAREALTLKQKKDAAYLRS